MYAQIPQPPPPIDQRFLGKPLHQISFIYSIMHIVLIFGRWTPKSSIDL